MSEIIEIIFPAKKLITPKLRVRCSTCAREYVTNQWAGTVRRLRYCRVCRPSPITKENASKMGKLGMRVRWRKK